MNPRIKLRPDYHPRSLYISEYVWQYDVGDIYIIRKLAASTV